MYRHGDSNRMPLRVIDSTEQLAIRPFPAEHYPELWRWLRQFPMQNFDDEGPDNLADFTKSMESRLAAGQSVFEVLHEDVPVGAIGILRYGDTAKFCGICFDRIVHGKGIAAAAVDEILSGLFNEGVRIVTATYFSDNMAVRKMFQKLGAVDVEQFRCAATRAGKPVSAITVKIFHKALRMQGVD